jgi:hypothetical protein
VSRPRHAERYEISGVVSPFVVVPQLLLLGGDEEEGREEDEGF